MNCLVYSVFMYLFLVCNTNAQQCDPDARPKSESELIRQKLLCNYDKDSRPGLSPQPGSQNQTKIQMFLSPITMEYVDSNAAIRMQTWIELFWQDQRFKWNKEDYPNKTHIILMEPKDVWMPDLSLTNWKDARIHLDKICSSVVVESDSWLYTSAVPVLSGHCIPDWTKWPFDVQKCELVLSSRQYLGHEIDYIIIESPSLKEGLYMDDFVPSREWQLISYKAERLTTDFGAYNNISMFRVDIKISLTIKRHASVLVSSYVMPGFVMILLSLSVLWFNPLTSRRISIICLLILLQSLFLQYLAYKIPSNGPKTPGIVIFYAGSLILTTVLLLLTMLSRSMYSWTSKPSIVSSLLNLLRTNRVLQLILFTELKTYSETYSSIEDDENDASSNKNSKLKGEPDWQELAFYINRIAFLILLPIYFILFLHFIV